MSRNSEEQPLLEESENDYLSITQITILTELWTVVEMALPVSMGYLLTFSLTIAQVFTVGRLGTSELAACALATMLCNVTGNIVGLGMASAMDTLCSQAYTASSDPHILGKILQRSLLIMFLLTIPVSVLWWYTESLLLLLGQEPKIALLSGIVARWMIPGLFPFLAADCLRRYLQCQGIVNPSMYITLIASPFNIFLQWLLVYSSYSLGLIGAPIATNITNFLIMFLTILYIIYYDGNDTWGGFSWNDMFDAKELKKFLKLGTSGVVMICAEWWAFEIVSLAVGWLGEKNLAAQTIILNTSYMFFTFPNGLSVAASTRVGNHLGAFLPNKSKNSAYASMICAILFASLNISALLTVRNYWGYLFTDDVDVVNIVASILPIAALFQIFDCLGAVSGAVLRGQGKQHYGAIMNIIAYYAVGLPISFLLCFTYNMGMTGIWIGLTLGLMCSSLTGSAIVMNSDWKEMCRKAQEI